MNSKRWHNRFPTWKSPMARIRFQSDDKRTGEPDEASGGWTPCDNLHSPDGGSLTFINSGGPPAHGNTGCIPTEPAVHNRGEVNVLLECPRQTVINQLLHHVAETNNAYFRMEDKERRWSLCSCFPGMWTRAGTSAMYAPAGQLQWKCLLSQLLGVLAEFRETYRQVQCEGHASSELQRNALHDPDDAEQPNEFQAEKLSQTIASEVEARTVGLEEEKKAILSEANAKQAILERRCQELVEKLSELDVSEKQAVTCKSLADQKIQQLELQNQELTQERDNLKQKFFEAEDRASQSVKFAQREMQALRATLDQVKVEKEGLQGQLSKLERLESERGKEVLLSGSYLDTEATPTLVQTMANKIKDTLSSFTKTYMQLQVKDSSSGPASLVDQYAKSLQKTVGRFPRTSHVKYTFEAAISAICFQHFESPTIDGLTWEPCLDREKARTESFEEFKRLRATKGQLPHPDTAHARFCFHYFAPIWPRQRDLAVFGTNSCSDLVASGKHPGGELYACFVGFATSVWLMHLLCASCEPVAPLFKVNPNDDFNPAYMESVAISEGAEGSKVAFMVVPGFRVGKSIIRSQVYLK